MKVVGELADAVPVGLLGALADRQKPQVTCRQAGRRRFLSWHGRNFFYRHNDVGYGLLLSIKPGPSEGGPALRGINQEAAHVRTKDGRTNMITSSRIIKWLAIYTSVVISAVTFLNAFSDNAHARAKVLMGFFLVLFWCLGFGLLSYYQRDRFKRLFSAIKIPWQVKFIVCAIALAMLEEVVTTSLTNAAPLLGSESGKAMITASTNYAEVAFLNSVWPVFVPWVLAWTVLLSRYAFPPNHVFLLFGLLGSVAETHFGVGSLVAGFWFFVYGLMVYLPAYSLPPRKTIPLRWWHYSYALLLPFLFMFPWGLLYAAVVHNLLGYDLMTAT